jgi:hypothetical protein
MRIEEFVSKILDETQLIKKYELIEDIIITYAKSNVIKFECKDKKFMIITVCEDIKNKSYLDWSLSMETSKNKRRSCYEVINNGTIIFFYE